jgi:hypothetical protein
MKLTVHMTATLADCLFMVDLLDRSAAGGAMM